MVAQKKALVGQHPGGQDDGDQSGILAFFCWKERIFAANALTAPSPSQSLTKAPLAVKL